jgi:hypothetical protein
MKEMVEIEKEIENIVRKLKGYEKTMAEKKGPFDLFGLFLRDDAPGKWDLLVAAEWIEENKEGSLKYIVDMVQKGLSKEELMKLSRVVVVDEGNLGLDGLYRAVGSARDTKIYNSNFFGLQLKYVYLMTLRGKRGGKKERRREEEGSA